MADAGICSNKKAAGVWHFIACHTPAGALSLSNQAA
jgi:hypothetical protein